MAIVQGAWPHPCLNVLDHGCTVCDQHCVNSSGHETVKNAAGCLGPGRSQACASNDLAYFGGGAKHWPESTDGSGPYITT